jgi:hypothetical protein
MAEETAKIKLYRKTYQLPQLNRPDLLVLQDQIQERQQLIKTRKTGSQYMAGIAGKRRTPQFRGNFSRIRKISRGL